MGLNDIGSCFKCGDEVAWFKTEKGKNIPIDPDPVPADDRDAKFMIDPDDDDTVVWVPRKERVGMMYSTHFDTCSDPTEVERRKREDEEWKKNRASRQ